MAKVTIDRALIERAIDVINSECGYGGSNSYEPRAIAEALRAALAETVVEPVPPPSDFDDAAVDRFAEALKTKMRASREKGRSGWHDSRICSGQSLQKMLVEHLAKGDPVDVGNFAMMLWNRGEPTTATLAAVEPVAWLYDFTIVGDNEVYTNWVTQDPTEVGKEVEGISNVRPLYTTPPPPAEQAKPPGMAVQALAGEIVAALLADEKDGGYDLAAGMFGPAFSALVRRWAAAEWNSPPDEPAVETVAVHQVKLDARRWRDIAKDEMQNYIAQGFWETRTLYTTPPPPAEPTRTSQDGCTVPLLSDEEILKLTPLWFKKYTDGVLLGHARAIEQLVRRKARL